MKELSGEFWKGIPGYPGYEVSNFGRVRSFWKHSSERIGIGSKMILMDQSHRIMRQVAISDGYKSVRLYRDGKGSSIRTHKLILEAFIGPCPAGQQTRHLDGTKNNNYLDNLCWGTPKENAEDKIRHGTATGNGGYSKLTANQVTEIRRLFEEGYFQATIGKMFSVSQSIVSLIVRRKIWAQVP